MFASIDAEIYYTASFEQIFAGFKHLKQVNIVQLNNSHDVNPEDEI